MIRSGIKPEPQSKGRCRVRPVIESLLNINSSIGVNNRVHFLGGRKLNISLLKFKRIDGLAKGNKDRYAAAIVIDCAARRKKC